MLEGVVSCSRGSCPARGEGFPARGGVSLLALTLSPRSCKQNQDMLSFYAIVIGLNNAAISRLRLTWEVKGRRGGPEHPSGCSQTPPQVLTNAPPPPGLVLQKLPGKFKNLFRKFENLTVSGARALAAARGGVVVGGPRQADRVLTLMGGDLRPPLPPNP